MAGPDHCSTLPLLPVPGDYDRHPRVPDKTSRTTIHPSSLATTLAVDRDRTPQASIPSSVNGCVIADTDGQLDWEPPRR